MRPGDVELEWGGGLGTRPESARPAGSAGPHGGKRQAWVHRPLDLGPGAAAISWLGDQGLGCPPPGCPGVCLGASPALPVGGGWFSQNCYLLLSLWSARELLARTHSGAGKPSPRPAGSRLPPTPPTAVRPGPRVPWYLASEKALREQRTQSQRLTSHRVALAQGGRKGELDREGVQEPIVRTVKENSNESRGVGHPMPSLGSPRAQVSHFCPFSCVPTPNPFLDARRTSFRVTQTQIESPQNG